MNDVVLRLDAEYAVPDPHHVMRDLQFAAKKAGVALRIDDLVVARARRATGGEALVAADAGEILEDEVAIARVIDRRLEPGIAARTLEPEFERVGFFERHGRIADLEGARCIVRPLVEQLDGIGGALDMLNGDARDDVVRQIVEQPGAGADRHETAVDRKHRGLIGWRQVVRRELRAGAAGFGLFDAQRTLRAQAWRDPQLLE